MKNKTLMSFDTDSDFYYFINSRFKKPIENIYFPYEYEKRRPPASSIADKTNPEVRNIIERELIRDNIYSKYKFDIYEYPIVVFYEDDGPNEELKSFKRIDIARDFCSELLNRGIFSLLISIMDHEINCRLVSK
jgi:hypothetical protein